MKIRLFPIRASLKFSHEHPWMKDFCLEKRIYYHNTDCGPVVYYGNYLKHLEEARTEYLLSKGIDLQKLADEGVWFAVAKVEMKYKSPARYQDTIRILTRVERTKISAILFFQQIFKDEVKILEARTALVCIGNDYQQAPLPEGIKRLLLARS